MLEVKITRLMKQDLKRSVKRGKMLAKLEPIVKSLVKGEALPAQYKDHSLTGVWRGYRDCHIEPDWLLIYKCDKQFLYLARTGTHSDLFKSK